MSLVFLGNNIKWKLILLLIFHHQSHIWQNPGSRVWTKCCQPIILHDCLRCNISRKKWMMNFIFGMQINLEVFYKLIQRFWVCVTRHTHNKFAYLAISQEKHGDRGGGWSRFFFLQENTKIFYKFIVSLCVSIGRHLQSTRHNKFTISLQYLKKT